jgi:hypothetical protein
MGGPGWYDHGGVIPPGRSLLRNDTSRTLAQNSRGEWVPAIPLPLFTWLHRHRCACGHSFWTMSGYRGHYALAHVLDPD